MLTPLALYYFVFVGCCTLLSFLNFRIGLWLMLVAGLLADPVRKLMPENPLYITLGFLPIAAAVYLAMIGTKVSGRKLLRVYPHLRTPLFIFLLSLAFSASIGLANKSPLLLVLVSLIQYLGIIIGVRIGYYMIQREKDVVKYAIVFALTLTPFLATVIFHFFGFQEKWPVLETMEFGFEPYYQYHSGEALAMLNGIFRAPEIMGWHAMITGICAMYLLARIRGVSFSKIAYVVLLLGAVLFVLLSGRRKMFMGLVILLFSASILLLRKNLKKLIGFIVVLSIVATGGFLYMKKQENVAGYLASVRSGFPAAEERVRTGIIGSMAYALQTSGFLGRGLGAATQGARHFQKDETRALMIEAGTGKILGELGVPGLIAVCILLGAFLGSCYRIILKELAEQRIIVTSSFLFSLTLVHAVSFALSYQVYADPLIGLLTGLMLGMLLAVPKMARVARPRRLAVSI